MKVNKSKKENGTVSPTLRQEFRNLGALIEDNRHCLSAVAEQFGDVKKTLDSHTEMIGSVMSDITDLKQDMSEVKQDVSVLKQDMGSVKGRLDVIQSDLEIVKNNLKRKVDAEDFEASVRRVSVIEKRVLN